MKQQPIEDYSVRAICLNCKHKQKISIPKGQLIKNFIRDCVCSKCDIKALQMMINQIDSGNDFFDDSFFENLVPNEIIVKNPKISEMIDLKIKVPAEYVEEINKFIIELNTNGKK